ncbi:glycosyltransferase family 4 protein [uncultured Microbacterium sp.]|uniref:glycosyltransferase family 4 protein n=1 Tax=uncultured Microbacterium sp. TaxID=191216 RepID=UPI0025CD8FFA|nr:glycosyltransferase family 4 protein [uncultured Microbacterium sp.]
MTARMPEASLERVLVISQLPPPLHGSTLMTRTLMQVLRDRGFDVDIVERRFSKAISEVGKFSVRKLFSATIIPVRLALRILRYKPGTVVFFATNRTFSFWVDVVLSGVLRAFRVRTILYLHTRGFADLAARSRLYNIFVKALLRSGDEIVCLGEALGGDVRPFVSAPVLSIPNAVSPPSGVRTAVTGPVLYLSNLIPEKGAGTFLNVAGSVAQSDPGARFVIAGAPVDDIFQASLVAQVENEGLTSQALFLGAISDQQRKWELLAGASVLVFPSTYAFEAQPLTILEAMAVGTPVVAFDVGGVRDIVSDGITGLVYATDDVEGMKEGVLRLLGDHELRGRMSREAAERFSRDFSLSVFGERWATLLRGGDSK